jgi:hypothetical protein
MDDRAFDDLTRRFAMKRSRRSLLKGVIGSGAALVAAQAGSRLGIANDERVLVCHATSGNRNRELLLPRPAADAHLAEHPGDTLGPCPSTETTPAPTTTTEAPTTTTEAPATTAEPCPPYTTRSASTGECVSPCASNPCSHCPRDSFVQCLATLDGHHVCDMAPFPVSNSGICPVNGCPQPGYFTCYQHVDGTYQCINSGMQC